MTLPNQLSILRIILTPVFLYFFLSENPLYRKLSMLVFFIATITDWYDGWHARKFGLVSAFGIFIDPLADKILTSAAFIGFCILGIMPLWMLVVIVTRDIVITLMRSYREYKGRTMKTSFIAKTKTFIQMTYIFIVIILVSLLSFDISVSMKENINMFLHSELNYYLILLITLVTFYTGVSYFFEIRDEEKT
ncbi:MAG: CDP-diacylglycerol--glycerol-3-phosphate 3-phosphatidyltransferase [Ignavibacteria bacterium]|nr:CDP-diacylglycerol--glycerol-3-phosphate 3-phosphatidyltransferase [Ignavibacteria bacterium]